MYIFFKNKLNSTRFVQQMSNANVMLKKAYQIQRYLTGVFLDKKIHLVTLKLMTTRNLLTFTTERRANIRPKQLKKTTS